MAVYEDHYIHDAFVRNDTMWAAEIYDGRFEVLDISDKTSFLSLGYAETYGVATHIVSRMPVAISFSLLMRYSTDISLLLISVI